MLTEAQIKERLSYIGASEAASVLGLSRWGSPLEVWAVKTGQVEAKDLSDNFAVEMGIELEDTVCRLFTKRTGKKTQRVNETLFHPKYPFIGCNLDRRIVGEDACLEAKTASGYKQKEWAGEDVPSEYILQVMHQLAVTGKKVGYIACLIGGNSEFVWKAIHRDEEAIKSIIEKEVYFWREFVEKKVMPGTITRNDGDILFRLFPEGTEDKAVELDDEALRILESLQAMKQDKFTLEGQIDQAENEIKARLKESSLGMVGDYRITWKNQIRNGLDLDRLKAEKPEVLADYKKQTESRVFRVTTKKEVKGEINVNNRSR